MSKKFKHLDLSPHWQQYFAKYPQGYTIIENLIDWVSQVDDMVDNQNTLNYRLDKFIEQFDENLQQEIVTRLTNWLEDGTLAKIINEDVFDMKLDRDEFLTFQTTIRGELDSIQEDITEQLTEQNNNIQQQLSDQDEKVTDSITAMEQLVEEKTGNTFVPVGTPEGFNWKNHPLENKIYTDGKGNYEVKGFNIHNYEPTGNTIYVDPINGNNENNGLTENSPIRTIGYGFGLGNSTVFKLKGGVYFRDEIMHNITINKNLVLKPHGNERVILTSGTALSNIQHDSGLVSTAYATQPPLMLIDLENTDENGDALRLTKVNSLNAVHTTSNSWYFDSSNSRLYFHPIDGRVPTTRDLIRLTDVPVLQSASGNHTLFIEGIDIYGGMPGVLIERRSPEYAPKFFAKDCSFKFSISQNSGDLVRIHRGGLTIFENCYAAKSAKDGFHYTGVELNVIEINCSFHEMGTGSWGASDNQCSTSHSGSKTIRINNRYDTSNGALVGDVSEQTQSWILGCRGSNSNAGNDSQNAVYMPYDHVEFWVEGSLAYNATYGISGNGIAHVKNNNLLTENEYNSSTTIREY